MSVLLTYNPEVADYRFSEAHPLRPERFSLAVELMREWGLLAETSGRERSDIGKDGLRTAATVEPGAASDADILLVHDADYVTLVKRAAKAPSRVIGRGIGPGDTPAFRDMHRAAALAVGATMAAVDSVLGGSAKAAFSPAGGLHHAHRGYASGFCIYNDAAIAIEHATLARPGLRVAYVDIDAHHGDGVEDVFAERSDVLTLSVHESGRYLFPGTGRATDIGRGAGQGYALNVPLPPDADEECYDLVSERVIAPALSAFRPQMLVVQAGGDSHRCDPLTHLYQSVEGYCRLLARILALAEELTGGRVVVTGGGGYCPFSEVPRMWAAALALLLGREVPRDLPAEWLTSSRDAALAAGHEPAAALSTFDESMGELGLERREIAMQATRHAVEQARASSPLIAGGRA